MTNQVMRGIMNYKLNNIMNQLKLNQPQGYQLLQAASQNKSNPIEIFKQFTKNYTPEQMSELYSLAQQVGYPNEVLSEIQNQMK